jgi:hypothetical protein
MCGDGQESGKGWPCDGRGTAGGRTTGTPRRTDAHGAGVLCTLPQCMLVPGVPVCLRLAHTGERWGPCTVVHRTAAARGFRSRRCRSSVVASTHGQQHTAKGDTRMARCNAQVAARNLCVSVLSPRAAVPLFPLPVSDGGGSLLQQPQRRRRGCCLPVFPCPCEHSPLTRLLRGVGIQWHACACSSAPLPLPLRLRTRPPPHAAAAAASSVPPALRAADRAD